MKLAVVPPLQAPPQPDPSEARLEFYVKLAVPLDRALDYIRHVYGVDHVEPEVAASILASSLKGPVALPMADTPRFVAMVRGGRN